MKKTFNRNKNSVSIRKKTVDPITVMNKEMRQVYNDFYGNKDRLEKEWNLCRDQYDIARKQSITKESSFDARIAIRKISTYWNKRMIALEESLTDDVIKEFKSNREKISKKENKP